METKDLIAGIAPTHGFRLVNDKVTQSADVSLEKLIGIFMKYSISPVWNNNFKHLKDIIH